MSGYDRAVNSPPEYARPLYVEGIDYFVLKDWCNCQPCNIYRHAEASTHVKCMCLKRMDGKCTAYSHKPKEFRVRRIIKSDKGITSSLDTISADGFMYRSTFGLNPVAIVFPHWLKAREVEPRDNRKASHRVFSHDCYSSSCMGISNVAAADFASEPMEPRCQLILTRQRSNLVKQFLKTFKSEDVNTRIDPSLDGWVQDALKQVPEDAVKPFEVKHMVKGLGNPAWLRAFTRELSRYNQNSNQHYSTKPGEPGAVRVQITSINKTHHR